MSEPTPKCERLLCAEDAVEARMIVLPEGDDMVALCAVHLADYDLALAALYGGAPEPKETES